MDIVEIESLCEQLFGGTGANASGAQAINQRLEDFVNSPNCLAGYRLLLDRASNVYSQYFAGIGLAKYFSQPGLSLTALEALELRNYLMNYLFLHNLPSFVQGSLAKAYATLTQRYWLLKVDNKLAFQDILNESQFMDSTDAQKITSLILLMNVVAVLNRPPKRVSSMFFSAFSRVQMSFKCSFLIKIMLFSLKLLQQSAQYMEKGGALTPEQTEIIRKVLSLCKECLSCEYSEGAYFDEVADIIGLYNRLNLKIGREREREGTSWAIAYDANIIPPLFKLAVDLPLDLACDSLVLLVGFATTRPFRIKKEERSAFLQALLNGVVNIMTNCTVRLSDQQYHYNFARLIAVMLNTFKLFDLILLLGDEGFNEFVHLLTRFSLLGIEMMQQSSNNLLFTLYAWKPIAGAFAELKDTNAVVKNSSLKILECFVSTRLKFLSALESDESLDNPLNDMVSLSQILTIVSDICEICIVEFGEYFLKTFDPLLAESRQKIAAGDKTGIENLILRLTWLVFVMAYIISCYKQIRTSANEKSEVFAGFALRSFEVVVFMKELPNDRRFDKLEIAVMNFLQFFRASLVVTRSATSMRVFAKLKEAVGVSDDEEMLVFMLNKIITNLKFRGDCLDVLQKTVELFLDMVNGLPYHPRLRDFDIMNELLRNCNAQQFPFLGITEWSREGLKVMKCRTEFYRAIGQILSMKYERDHDIGFIMVILTQFAEQFEAISRFLPAADYNTSFQMAVIGLARDLRGLVWTIRNPEPYCVIFEFLYPKYIDLFLDVLDHFYNVPEIVSPILKFFGELVMPRHFLFPAYSPYPVYIFRCMCKCFCTYASRMGSFQVTEPDAYAKKYKGIKTCLEMLHRAVTDPIVHLGVFEAFGDPVLENTMKSFMELLITIPPEDIFCYPKLLQRYFSLLQSLACENSRFILNLNSPAFVHIVTSLRAGLESNETCSVASCESVLSAILKLVYNHITNGNKKPNQANGNLISLMQQHVSAFEEILSFEFRVVVFEDAVKHVFVETFVLLVRIYLSHFDKLCQELLQNIKSETERESLQRRIEEFREFVLKTDSLSSDDNSDILQHVACFKNAVTKAMDAVPTASESVDMIS